MSVPALTVVPAGTTIDLRITLPRGAGTAAFRWQAPEKMEAAAVRAEIARDLVPRFFRNFLPKDD